MSWPTLTVRVAFATEPLAATPTWTDVSDYVRSVRIRRGRQDELNRIEAGVAEVTLDNRDRRFDPTNTSSPYYPNVLPMRKINIRATWNSVTYDLYTGYIENWPPDWPLTDDSSVTLDCVDGFKYFAMATLTLTVVSDEGGWQIKATSGVGGYDGILINLSWPNADQSVNAGASTLQGWTMTNEPVLQRLQLIAESENGYLMMTVDGKIFFRERHYRLTNADSVTSTGTYGDDSASGELPYVELVPSFDDSLIYNDIHITRVGGSEQIASDSASQAAYFKRSLIKTGLLIATDDEASDAANWLLAQYKDAALRFKRLTINPQTLPTNLWPAALDRDIHDRITVKRRPPGGGNVISQECFIEGVEHVIDGGPVTRWLTTWDLSPASSQSYWVLDDAVLSILDSTTKLIY